MGNKFFSQDPSNFTTGDQVGMLGRNIDVDDCGSDMATTLDGVPNHQVYQQFLRVLSGFETTDPALLENSKHTIRAILGLRNWANDRSVYLNSVHLRTFTYAYMRAKARSAAEQTIEDKVNLKIVEVLGVEEHTMSLLRAYLNASTEYAEYQKGSLFEKQEHARASRENSEF